jgi:hypothetical protein
MCEVEQKARIALAGARTRVGASASHFAPFAAAFLLP